MEVVYQTGMAHQSAQHLLHLPSWQSVREFVRGAGLSIARIDRAVKEGKALDVLQERLIRAKGIEGIQLDPSRMERQERVTRVFIVSSNQLTKDEQAVVHATVDEVNRRFGSHVYAFILSPRQK